MREKEHKPKPTGKGKTKDGKAKTTVSKDDKLSEEDLRKISGGIEPRVYKPT